MNYSRSYAFSEGTVANPTIQRFSVNIQILHPVDNSAVMHFVHQQLKIGLAPPSVKYTV